jgi:hypothetical protein
MSDGRIFFIIFSALIALSGLVAAASANDYLHLFGLALFAFGALFLFGCVRRHYDELEGTAER